MEERVPPTATSSHHQYDDESRHGHPEHQDSKNNTNNTNNYNINNNEFNPTGGPPLRTYIVQIPKDQIYRVPPPEHAQIVERYRNPAKTKRRCTPCMSWSLSVLFTIAILITLIVCIHHFTLSPKLPTFSVKYFTVKYPPTSKKNGSNTYKISVGTTNPNRHNYIEYSQGSARLIYKEKVVGKGNFPPLDTVQGGKSYRVDLVLKGSGAMGGLSKKSKSPVSLDLTMTIEVKLRTWLFTKNIEATVNCEFKVNSFGNNAKVISQNCAYQN